MSRDTESNKRNGQPADAVVGASVNVSEEQTLNHLHDIGHRNDGLHSIIHSVEESLSVLKNITASERGITRLAFSDEDWAGRSYLIKRMEGMGLVVREDAFGNVIGRLPGLDDSLPPIMSGSHGDSVPEGGNFDGIVGVLSALEVARLLQDEHGKSMIQHPYEVIIFMGEEGSRFGAAMIGSEALVGKLTQADLDRLTDHEGVTLRQALQYRNLDDKAIGKPLYDGPIHAYIEAHIEQGRVLEELKYPLGVVTGIAGATRHRLTFSGRADHSGATPMNMRRDALCGAAEVILQAEALASEMTETANRAALDPEDEYMVAGRIIKHSDLAPVVATAGTVQVTPGALNVIPGAVELGLDIRSISKTAKRLVWDALLGFIESMCERRDLTVDYRLVMDGTPVVLKESMIQILSKAANECGVASMLLPSGAGHDAMNMAEITPTGMLFIPCKDGVSHSPMEWADSIHIANGVRVLEKAVRLLDETDNL